MGDYWMTSGRSRLKAMEKNSNFAAARRQRNRQRSSAWQMPYPPSTQMTNHPKRPKSPSEFLQGKKGYVDPFTRRGVVAQAPRSTQQFQQRKSMGLMATAPSNNDANKPSSTLNYRRVTQGMRRHPQNRRQGASSSLGVPSTSEAASRTPGLMNRFSQHGYLGRQYQAGLPQRENRSVFHPLTQQHNNQQHQVRATTNLPFASSNRSRHLHPPQQPWVEQQHQEQEVQEDNQWGEEHEGSFCAFHENSVGAKWGGPVANNLSTRHHNTDFGGPFETGAWEQDEQDGNALQNVYGNQPQAPPNRSTGFARFQTPAPNSTLQEEDGLGLDLGTSTMFGHDQDGELHGEGGEPFATSFQSSAENDTAHDLEEWPNENHAVKEQTEPLVAMQDAPLHPKTPWEKLLASRNRSSEPESSYQLRENPLDEQNGTEDLRTSFQDARPKTPWERFVASRNRSQTPRSPPIQKIVGERNDTGDSSTFGLQSESGTASHKRPPVVITTTAQDPTHVSRGSSNRPRSAPTQSDPMQQTDNSSVQSEEENILHPMEHNPRFHTPGWLGVTIVNGSSSQRVDLNGHPIFSTGSAPADYSPLAVPPKSNKAASTNNPSESEDSMAREAISSKNYEPPEAHTDSKLRAAHPGNNGKGVTISATSPNNGERVAPSSTSSDTAKQMKELSAEVVRQRETLSRLEKALEARPVQERDSKRELPSSTKKQTKNGRTGSKKIQDNGHRSNKSRKAEYASPNEQYDDNSSIDLLSDTDLMNETSMWG